MISTQTLPFTQLHPLQREQRIKTGARIHKQTLLRMHSGHCLKSLYFLSDASQILVITFVIIIITHFDSISQPLHGQNPFFPPCHALHHHRGVSRMKATCVDSVSKKCNIGCQKKVPGKITVDFPPRSVLAMSNQIRLAALHPAQSFPVHLSTYWRCCRMGLCNIGVCATTQLRSQVHAGGTVCFLDENIRLPYLGLDPWL